MPQTRVRAICTRVRQVCAQERGVRRGEGGTGTEHEVGTCSYRVGVMLPRPQRVDGAIDTPHAAAASAASREMSPAVGATGAVAPPLPPGTTRRISGSASQVMQNV